ncbi:MAG: S-adenosylmethionine:tRNA ribosyltransferase-isomerase [Candidatus Aminicenantales bacterium]
MLEESFFLSPETAWALNQARKEGRPVTAVGTTVVRTLVSGNSRIRTVTSHGWATAPPRLLESPLRNLPNRGGGGND